jgi:hypothetical protein
VKRLVKNINSMAFINIAGNVIKKVALNVVRLGVDCCIIIKKKRKKNEEKKEESVEPNKYEKLLNVT